MYDCTLEMVPILCNRMACHFLCTLLIESMQSLKINNSFIMSIVKHTHTIKHTHTHTHTHTATHTHTHTTQRVMQLKFVSRIAMTEKLNSPAVAMEGGTKTSAI